MADQEKTVGAIEALEKTVLKSLEDHSGSIIGVPKSTIGAVG